MGKRYPDGRSGRSAAAGGFRRAVRIRCPTHRSEPGAAPGPGSAAAATGCGQLRRMVAPVRVLIRVASGETPFPGCAGKGTRYAQPAVRPGGPPPAVAKTGFRTVSFGRAWVLTQYYNWWRLGKRTRLI